MKNAYLVLIGAIVGGLLGCFVANCVRQLKLWIWPPGPMMMGDLEGLVFGLAGLLIGTGLGGSLGVWHQRRFASGSHELEPHPTRGRNLNKLSWVQFVFALVSATIFFGVSFYYSRWEQGDYAKSGIATFQAMNLVLPLLALSVVARFTRAQTFPSYFVLLAAILMIGSLIWIHWPGQYQTIASGVPTGEPNGTYGFALLLGCVLNWGLVLIATMFSFAWRMASRPRPIHDN